MEFKVSPPEDKKPEGKKNRYEGLIFRGSIALLVISAFILLSITAIQTSFQYNKHLWNYCDESCFNSGLGRSNSGDRIENCECEREILPVQIQGQTYYLMCDFGIKAETNLNDVNTLNKYHCMPIQSPQTK
jgi:hypothetical protein